MDALPIAVLISGGGTTLQNLIQHQQQRGLPVEFRGVISSRSKVGGIAIAENAGIPLQIMPRKKYSSDQDYSQAIFGQIRAWGCRLVVMGGFLQHLLIPEEFLQSTINIHPSLIPAFSGKGFYGLHVHEAAVAYGVKVSGCTVHFVDNQYDHGPVIAQRSCPVLDHDSPQDVQKRVFQIECELLPEVIRLFAANKIHIEGRRVRVAD
jgi:phosphoribosylglycinamide formyltransferase-1